MRKVWERVPAPLNRCYEHERNLYGTADLQ